MVENIWGRNSFSRQIFLKYLITLSHHLVFIFPFPFPASPGNDSLWFPFPKFGNGFLQSLPIPEFWEWLFFIPFPFPNFGKGFFSIHFPFQNLKNGIIHSHSRFRAPKSHSCSPLTPSMQRHMFHICLIRYPVGFCNCFNYSLWYSFHMLSQILSESRLDS